MKAYFNAALAHHCNRHRDAPASALETQLANPFTVQLLLAGDTNAVPTGNTLGAEIEKENGLKKVFCIQFNPNINFQRDDFGDTLAV